MKEKKIIIIVLILLLIILVIPVKLHHKDGGTIEYKSLTYKIIKWHRLDEYYDNGYMQATMGCRTYLMSNINGEPGTKGRGNIAPITIKLPRIGIEANKDIDKFFEILEERPSIASFIFCI